MYPLSDQQIEYILNDIQSRGIGDESLRHNLLDHVCCIIEQNLEEKGDFESFYQMTIATFYEVSLKEIEDESAILSTFKHYYKMKKAMIYAGVISTVFLTIGALLKILFLPGASLFILLGIVGVSILFLPLLAIVKIKEIPERRDKWVLTLGIMAGCGYFLSMLFLLFQFPGARSLWIVTLSLSFFGFLPMYFFTGIRRAETRANTIVTAILLFCVLGTQFALTPRSVHKSKSQTMVSAIANR
ncbi:MAG: hypothetical protein JST52_00245 [Bacteroidetes bacterium]|nr:hypothetical protein [Bacteroidota bacterium]MBS1739531.1 hypothetical protein [Bacteroidota bacterium]